MVRTLLPLQGHSASLVGELRSHKLNGVAKKVNKERIKIVAEVAKIYGKNESSVCEIVKKEKELRASFAVSPQTAKVTATESGKCLIKVEKALNLYNKVFGERLHSHKFITIYCFNYSILLLVIIFNV